MPKKKKRRLQGLPWQGLKCRAYKGREDFSKRGQFHPVGSSRETSSIHPPPKKCAPPENKMVGRVWASPSLIFLAAVVAVVLLSEGPTGTAADDHYGGKVS